MRFLWVALAAIATLALTSAAVAPFLEESDQDRSDAPPTMPKSTGVVAEGSSLFEENCAACHGEGAVGTDQGPTFLHRVYEPSHHSDMAFQLAVQNGVRAHHWKFGNMPPIEGIGESEIEKIIAYVRSLQKAHGIE